MRITLSTSSEPMQAETQPAYSPRSPPSQVTSRMCDPEEGSTTISSGWHVSGTSRRATRNLRENR